MKHSREFFLQLSVLLGLFFSVPVSAEQVIFSEIQYHAKAGQPDFLELTNITATPLDMGEWYFSDGIVYTFPDFDPGNPDAHILKHYETILISPVDEDTLRSAYPTIPPGVRIFGPYAGALSNAGETVTLNDKNGVVLTTVDYNDGFKWPAAADGTGHTLTRINPNRSNAGWRNWKASRMPGGTPGVTPFRAEGPPTFTTEITQTTSRWKYDQNIGNRDLGTAWREFDFDDSQWQEGPGLFGRDAPGDPFATLWGTGDRVTYYLRRSFDFNEPFAGASIDLEAHLDDGAVFYLNGQEIARFNMPEGEINFDTPAVESREWDELVGILSQSDISNALRPGRNVLAVEVHNFDVANRDIGFGAKVSITAVEPPPNPLPDLLISEVHFDRDGIVDWIELHAAGENAISVDGLSFSNTRSLANPVAISGSIPAGGYRSFPISLTLDESGDLDLFLIRGDVVVDAARLDRDFGEESFQSLPVGQEWYGGPGHTRDAPNDPEIRETSIVINEIMYDTPSDQDSRDYLELYHRGTETVDLSGWQITKGVRFVFPEGTTMDPGDYLVVAADVGFIREAYGNIRVIGNWERKLSDRGELVRIEDRFGNLIDEVDYMQGGDWPNFAGGDGSSMELRHPDMNNDFPTAWADSDETGKSQMESFSYTADFTRAPWLPVSAGQELHAHLVGDAHVILENVAVQLEGTGGNLLNNADVMSPTSSSAQGWVCQGTHHLSFFDGGKLNLISTGHGDNKANRAEVDFGSALSVGQSYTLTFDARWIYGKSRIIFQTLDHGFGTSFLLPIPDNLGTPGAPNSTLLESPAPAVSDVLHSPAVPDVSQTVTVSARVDSPTPNPVVELVYRLDTSTGDGPWLRKEMTRDGNGHYATTVNRFTNQGDIIQFYVEATSGGSSTTQPKYGAARPALWIVDGREMPGKLLQNRFVVSEYDRRALNTSIGGGAAFDYNFPRMSNQYFNATFIANESEIYYNAEIRKSGSPFTRATNSNIDQGKWKLPGDRLFRGRGRNVIDASGTPQGSGTPRFYDDRMGRYLLYQLGHPINEMEYTYIVINDDRVNPRENHEPISNDFLRRNFPEGTKGTLLRIDDHWRFNDSGGQAGSRNADWSYKDTENPIAYHSPFNMRTREADHDYGTFIEFTRLLDQNRLEPEILNRVTDSEMLALNAAVRGYNGDWDTITMRRGKNGYFYRPKNGNGWMLLHWDGDRVFGNTGEAFLGNLPGVGKYFNQPFVRRQMNYYLTKLLDEHTRGSARTEAWMDAEIDAVSGTDVRMTKSHYLNWFNNRESGARNFVGSSDANTPFAINSSNATTSEDVITLTGTAPPTIFAVRVAGQPDTHLEWTSRTAWELSGVVLGEGSNTLIVEGIDHKGERVEQLTFNLTKTGNSAPVVRLTSNPRSLHLEVGQDFVVSAAASYDPEGDALTYEWSVLPEDGSVLTPTGSLVNGVFGKPGFYLINVKVSDSQGEITTRSLGVSVHFEHRFSSFNGQSLDSAWTPVKVERHDNSSPDSYYTLEDREGRLTLKLPLGQRSIALPEPVLPPPSNYIDFGSEWKYNDSNEELTGTFAQPGFDDSDWPSGPGFLGFNEPGLPAPGLQTPNLRPGFRNGMVTYYFRKEFEFTDNPIGARLQIDHIVDDGVRYYLNGQVLDSIRLPDGPIDSKTEAERLEEENVIEEDIVNLDVSASLVNGTNVLAAEVHNSSSGDRDLVFGARVDIAANPVQDGPPDLNEVPHPWITRPLPSGDWILETEIELEKSQFGEFFAGLLVEAQQEGNAFRYGVGFKNGDALAAFRLNPSGTVETLAETPELVRNKAVFRLEKKGHLLNFEQMENGVFATIHQLALPEGTSFSVGGIFASTEMEQSLEASFSYALLIDPTSDFSDWMTQNGLSNPDAEFGKTGMSNLLAYALGRDLNPAVAPVIVLDNGRVGFRHRQRVIGGQLRYRVERSTDLFSWEPAGDLTPSGEAIENPDGTYTINLLSDLAPPDGEQVYYRLVVNLF